MGYLHSSPTFVAMMMKLQMEWDSLAKERGLKNVPLEIIVYYVLLYGLTEKKLLVYFITVLFVLKHHHTTLKLENFKCFQDRCEFVCMDVADGGTKPTHSKTKFFHDRAT